MNYPNYIPSTRRYVHGDWPVKRHFFMANSDQRILHSNAKTGKELRLSYANLSTEKIQNFLFHYDHVLGKQAAFQLPPEVFGGWTEVKLIFGSDLYWRYKESPRITSQRGLYATVELTLQLATVDTGYIGPLDGTQEGVECPDGPRAVPPGPVVGGT